MTVSLVVSKQLLFQVVTREVEVVTKVGVAVTKEAEVVTKEVEAVTKAAEVVTKVVVVVTKEAEVVTKVGEVVTKVMEEEEVVVKEVEEEGGEEEAIDHDNSMNYKLSKIGSEIQASVICWGASVFVPKQIDIRYEALLFPQERYCQLVLQ